MSYFVSLLISLCFSSSVMAGVTHEVSLRDKIGQMLLIGFDGKNVNAQSTIIKTIEKNNIGGVILFDYDYRTKTYDRNIE
ncbi:TPA: glycoside hydrolase family 3 protein, partial [Legionella pneumophila]|nr:glycoside hydrolase family 3 protein [Legionella pneumophila]